MSFRRELGRFDTAMVVVGGIIGAGIFINPYIVAQRLDSPAFALLALGVPAYLFWSRRSKDASVAGAEADPPATGKVDG